MAIPDASIKGVGEVPEMQGAGPIVSPGLQPPAQISVPEQVPEQLANREASQEVASRASSGTPLAIMRESPPTSAQTVLGTTSGTVERPPSPSMMKRSESMMKLGSLRGMPKITPKDVEGVQKSIKKEIEDAKERLTTLKEKAMPPKIPGISLLHIGAYASDKKTRESMQNLADDLIKYPQIASDAKFCRDFLSGLDPQAKRDCFVALLSNKGISQETVKQLLSHEVNKDGMIKEIKHDVAKSYEKFEKKFGEINKLNDDILRRERETKLKAKDQFGYDPTTEGARASGDQEKFAKLWNEINSQDKTLQALRKEIGRVSKDASSLGEQIGEQLGLHFMLNSDSALAQYNELGAKLADSKGKLADESQSKFGQALAGSLVTKLPHEMSQKILGDYIRAEAAKPPPFRITNSLTASLFGAAFRAEFGQIGHELTKRFSIDNETAVRTLTANASVYMDFLASRLSTPNPTVTFLLRTIASELKQEGQAYACNVVFLRALIPELADAGYNRLAAVLQGQAAVDKYASSSQLQAIAKQLLS